MIALIIRTVDDGEDIEVERLSTGCHFLNFLINNMRITHEKFLERQNDFVLKLAELYGEVLHLQNSADFESSNDYLYIKRL